MDKKDKRTGWLAELKEGDKVFAFSSSYGANAYVLMLVKRITPTGRIVATPLDGRYENTYYPDGKEIGGNIWSCQYLKEFTEEKNLQLKRNSRKREIIRFIKEQADLKVLSLDELEEIEKMLTGKQEEKE